MIIVHHLNNSRSQRILWLLEELATPYEIKHYNRDAVTNLAPPELKAVHPLGKSPVIEADGKIIFESGAITDWIIRKHGQGRFMPAPGTAAHEDYLMWLHFAEGSAMTPILLNLYTARLGDAAAPLFRNGDVIVLSPQADVRRDDQIVAILRGEPVDDRAPEPVP